MSMPSYLNLCCKSSGAFIILVILSFNVFAIADPTPSRAIGQNNDGVRRMLEGNYPAAIAAFTKSLELDPSYNLALVNRGLAKEKLKDYQGAIADFTEGMKFKEQCGALDNRARVELEIEDYRQALADYNLLISMYSQPQVLVGFYHSRAIAKELLNDKSGAAEDLDYEKQLKARLHNN